MKKKKLEIEKERSLIEKSESKETLEFPPQKFQVLFVVCFSSDLLDTPHSFFLKKNCSRTPHTHLPVVACVCQGGGGGVCVGIRYPFLGQAPGGHGDGWHGEAHDLHHSHYTHRRFFFEVNVCVCVCVCMYEYDVCVGGRDRGAGRCWH